MATVWVAPCCSSLLNFLCILCFIVHLINVHLLYFHLFLLTYTLLRWISRLQAQMASVPGQCNKEAVYRIGHSRLFLRKIRSLNVCKKMLQIFYQSVVACIVFLLQCAGALASDPVTTAN